MSQKLYARAKGLWSRLRRTPHGPAAPPTAATAGRHPPTTTAAAAAKAHAHPPAPAQASAAYAQPLYARAAVAAANAHAHIAAVAAPRAAAYAPAAAAHTATRVTVAAHSHAINASVRKLHLAQSAAVKNPHAFITDGSSLTEVVLCRHTREATLVSTPARPDVEFESPRSDALASYRAFVAALNSAHREHGHRRHHTRSSFQGHFGAFGLLSAVGAILSNTDKAKAEGKDKDKDQKERKAFKTLTDIFSTLKHEKEKNLNRDSKPWSKHDDVSISSYFPASINPHARARANKPDAPNPKAPAQFKVETVAAPSPAVSSANTGARTGSAGESKCNKENVEPQQLSAAAKAEAAVYAGASGGVASSSSSDAAADLAASQQVLRLNADEQKVLDEARAYYDQKVDGDGALVLGRDDISPSKWQGLALYLTCTSTVQSLRLQNVDIDAEAARVLGATKRYARSLRHVTLCDNGIGTTRVAASAADAGAAAAAAAAVSALDPNECLNALIDFLLRCILLESLAILRNSVRDQHVPSLQRLLVQHRSLMRLSLCWNGIADSGAKALAKAIETYSSNLREIDLSYNSVGAEARSYVEQCAHHHVLRCGRETRFRLEHNRAQPLPDLIGVG